MTTAYHSAILDYPMETVWSLIRDFNNYPAYIDGVSESIIEDGKRGDEIGAVRRFNYRGSWIRQRLGGHSDEQHAFTYVGIDPFSLPGEPELSPVVYEGTIRLLPVVERGETFIESSVRLDAKHDQAERWRTAFEPLIAVWTDSLRRTLARKTTAT